MRAHLALTSEAHDALIQSAIEDATDQFQRDVAQRFSTTTYRLSLNTWPGSDDDHLITLPVPPCQSVESVKYTDTAGVEQTLVVDDDYTVDVEGIRGIVAPVTSWPSAKAIRNAIRVEFTAGYDADDRPLPDAILRGIKLLAAHMFLNRSVASDIMLSTVPLAYSEIVDSFKANW